MQIVPPEVAILLVAAYVARALNKLPPYWERLLSGLRFYQPVSEAEIVQAVRVTAAEPSPATLSRGAVQTADAVIGELVEARGATVTYSYFPMARFPWSGVQYMDIVSSMTMSAVHIAMTVVLVQAWQAFRGTETSGGPYTDLMIAFTIVLFLRGPASLYSEMGRSSFKVVSSAIAGLLMTFVSLALIHTPSGIVRAIASAPLRHALRFVASASATAASRLFAQDLAAARAALSDGEAAAAGIPAVETVVINDDDLDSSIRLWSITLSLLIGVMATYLAAGVGTTATLFYENAISRNRVASKGSASTTQGGRWTVSGAVYFFAPYVALIAACGWGVGLGAGSAAIPVTYVPCEAPTGEEIITAPRDCMISPSTGAVVPVTAGLLSQLATLSFTETGWQTTVALGLLVLVVAQVTAGLRYVLQAHLSSGKWEQVSLLMDASRIVAGAGEQAPAPGSQLASTPGGGILSPQGLQVISTQAAIKSKRTAFAAAVAAIYALAAPLVLGGLALLLLRRGGLLGATFGGASYGSLGPEALVAPASKSSEALEATLGVVGAATVTAFFHPAVQRAVIGYVLTLLLAFVAVTQSASILYTQSIWPSLEMSRKDKKEEAPKPAAAPSAAAPAAAPAAAEAGSGARAKKRN